MQKGKALILTLMILCVFGFMRYEAAATNAKYDFSQMPDMSDFDPNAPKKLGGDTIKIAVIAAFSGPGAPTGEAFYLGVSWAAHDINKRGGVMVDGKKKMIEVLKADNQSRPDITKKVTERMILQEKVDILWGSHMSHLTKVVALLGKRYKKIHINATSLSDELMEGRNFSKYSFMVSFSTEQIGRAMAYYYGNIRKKEKKFYILCQEYLFGRALADAFKMGLKEYFPDAQVVGEDYHRLYLTDFAPYLTKIKASGAEVIFTGDFNPDAANLLKQTRQMGIKLPFANVFINDPVTLAEVGPKGGTGLVNITQAGTGNPVFKSEEYIKYYKSWNNLWRNKWKAPYDKAIYQHPLGNMSIYLASVYWAASVLERAKTTNPEKIIEIWEGDSYQMPNGKLITMRACDHKMITALHSYEFVPPEQQKQAFNIPPYYWFEKTAGAGPVHEIPADKVQPKADSKLCN